MKKMRLVWIALALLMVLSPVALYAQNSVVTTVERDLWLRVGPGTQWRKLEIMPAGMNVALDGRTEDGLWVRGINSNGNVGWMAANYLPIGNDTVFSLPVIDREAPITVSAPGANAATTTSSSSSEADTAGDTASSPPPAVAAVEGGTVASATANVNVRSGPSTDYRRVGGLRNGERFAIDGRDPGITWVRGITPGGTVGWVSTRYISLNYDQVAALPIVDVDSPFGLAAPGGGGNTDTASGSEAPVAAQPITSTAPVTGFSYGGHVASFGPRTVNAMRSAGMTWVKKQLRYSQGQDPSSAAGLISAAHGNGFRIVLGIVGSPSQLNNPGYFDAYANFVAGVAGLGADAIEIWNEPNIDREWPTGQIDPARYTQLLAQSYNAIKSVNPNVMVISGAPAPTGFFGGCGPAGCDDNVYLSGMAAAGAANYMDCIGAHYNEGIVGPSVTSGDPRSEHYTRYFWGMVNTYYNAFGGAKPICFTELGYLSPEGFGPLPGAFSWAGGTTVAQQAAWLSEAISLSRSSGRVRLVIVWNVDFTNYGADPMAGYAMIRPDGSCPACAALR